MAATIGDLADFARVRAGRQVLIAARQVASHRQWQWQWQRYQSAAGVIPLPLLATALPLAVLYDGIDPRPAFPRAVER